MQESLKLLTDLAMMPPERFAQKTENWGKYYQCMDNTGKEIQSCAVAIDALDEIQRYKGIEESLKEKYHANIDIPTFMMYFIETVFEDDKHEHFCLLTNEDHDMWDQYRKLGTPEEIQAKLRFLDFLANSMTEERFQIHKKCFDEKEGEKNAFKI